MSYQISCIKYLCYQPSEENATQDDIVGWLLSESSEMMINLYYKENCNNGSLSTSKSHMKHHLNS